MPYKRLLDNYYIPCAPAALPWSLALSSPGARGSIRYLNTAHRTYCTPHSVRSSIRYLSTAHGIVCVAAYAVSVPHSAQHARSTLPATCQTTLCQPGSSIAYVSIRLSCIGRVGN
eukprot:85242-Rhodomonas_salina.1